MKGFLSLIGITVIVTAFGLILWSFSDNPLDKLYKEERLTTYMEIRKTEGQPKTDLNNVSPASMAISYDAAPIFYFDTEMSCGQPDDD